MSQSIDRLLDAVQWKEHPKQEPGELPHATHSGLLKIMDIEMRVYRLSDGRAIIDAEDMHKFLGDFL
jgi:hypothetical protein